MHYSLLLTSLVTEMPVATWKVTYFYEKQFFVKDDDNVNNNDNH